MEDNLKILKVEYLSNLLLDHTQILNLSLYDLTIFYKWNISATTYWILLDFTLMLRLPNVIVQIL